MHTVAKLTNALGMALLLSGTALAKDADIGESSEQKALKNRSAIPTEGDMDAKVTLAALLDKPGKDAWSNAKAARVEGTVVQVEREPDGDIHIVMAPPGQETDTRRWVIVEVPEKAQKKHDELSLKAVRKLRGKQVRATGWLYYEQDLEQQDPRGTLWELHPVTQITEVTTT